MPYYNECNFNGLNQNRKQIKLNPMQTVPEGVCHAFLNCFSDIVASVLTRLLKHKVTLPSFLIDFKVHFQQKD